MGKWKNATYILCGVWIIGLVILMWNRNFCEIDITDEIHYIGEAYLVANGAVPYAYNMRLASGFTFLMMPLVKLYQIYCPNMEGIFLYMRMCFLVFHVLILLLSYQLLRKQFEKKQLCMALAMLIPFWGMTIPNFSYNTISIWFIFLIGIINVSTILSQEYKKIKLGAAVSGVLMAFVEFAHPGQIFNIFYIGILLLCFNEKGKRWRPFLYYILGGASVVVIVVGSIIAQTNIHALIYGWNTILNYSAWIPARPISYALNLLWDSFKWEFIIMASVIALFIVLSYIKSKSEEKKINTAFREYGLMGLLIGIAAALGYIMLKKEGADILYAVGAVGGIATLLYVPFGAVRRKRKNDLIWLFLAVPSFLLLIMNGFFAHCLVYKRAYEMIPAFFAIMLILGEEFCNVKKAMRYLQMGVLVLAAILMLRSDYEYVYRGNPINTLTKRIEDGIYKGICTTPERAEDIVLLENYIHDNTDEEECILFMETVPMAYLMSDGKACAPSTWDVLQYSYGCNDPEALYRYFDSQNRIPDKIIYIDTGRDDLLSIETEDYKFNDFVNKNYCLLKENQIGESYRIKVYENVLKCTGDKFEKVSK